MYSQLDEKTKFRKTQKARYFCAMLFLTTFLCALLCFGYFSVKQNITLNEHNTTLLTGVVESIDYDADECGIYTINISAPSKYSIYLSGLQIKNLDEFDSITMGSEVTYRIYNKDSGVSIKNKPMQVAYFEVDNVVITDFDNFKELINFYISSNTIVSLIFMSVSFLACLYFSSIYVKAENDILKKQLNG